MSRAIVLFGHGSRDPAWREPMDEVARRVRARHPDLQVACAFLDLQAPDLGSAIDAQVAAGATAVRVVPMFLGVGKHAREDLPALLEAARQRHPGVALEAVPSVGDDDAVLDAIAALATRQP